MTPDEILAAIREIYFRTSPTTIDGDFAQAVDLLKQLPDEAARERASVFMEGLSEMRREFKGAKRGTPRRRG